MSEPKEIEEAGIMDCLPDLPDLTSLFNVNFTLYGKVPNLDFFPPDFTIDLDGFFDFAMIVDGIGLDCLLGYEGKPVGPGQYTMRGKGPVLKNVID